MADDLTALLAEIEARAAAATAEPWTRDAPAGDDVLWHGKEYLAHFADKEGNSEANCEFAAHARTDVPRLVAALRFVAVEDVHLGRCASKAVIELPCDCGINQRIAAILRGEGWRAPPAFSRPWTVEPRSHRGERPAGDSL